MKRTIFEGTVNGEKFNTVQEYNARLTELLNAGVNVEASSNTRVEDEEEVASADFTRSCTDAVYEDEELSYYPYCEDDDPYYLDLLVTEDADVNDDAKKEMHRIFDKCFKYICDALYDPSVTETTKKEYLADIRDICTRLNQDNKYNTEAIVNVKKSKSVAEEAFKRAQQDYENAMSRLNAEEQILRDAKPIIDDFIRFYSAVEGETLQSIAECRSKCNCCGEPTDKCKCSVDTTIKEAEPQRAYDMQTLIDKVFGLDANKNIRRLF